MTKNIWIGIAAALLSLHGASASAKLTHIAWNANGEFKHESTVAAGQFAELCGPVGVGTQVEWSFDSSEPMEGNIHFHVGKDVVYPTKFSALSAAKGKLLVAKTEDHCWMWTNRSAAPVQLKAMLKRPM